MPNLPQVSVKQYNAQWIIEYQASKKLSNTTVVKSGVIGDSYNWPRVGVVQMTLRGAPQSDIITTDQNYQQINTLFNNYDLKLATDIFQQAEVNVSDRQQAAQNSAMAVGRQEDQILIDEFNSATSGHSTIVDGGTNMPIDKIIEAMELLNNSSVPSSTRYIALGASQISSLIKQEKVSSSDYSSVKALMNGVVGSYMGATLIMIPDQFLNGNKIYGLPKTGPIRTCFAWQQSAAGFVYGSFMGMANPSVTVDWDFDKQSWATISKLRAGASVLLEDGFVKIECDETV
jgi:hypothetical protein